MQDFQDLDVWQESHQLTLDVYNATKRFPDDERFGLTAQLRRAVVSIESNIAEGCGRGSDADFARFVQTAFGSASEVECQVLIARDLAYMDVDASSALSDRVRRIKRMLTALLKRLRTNR